MRHPGQQGATRETALPTHVLPVAIWNGSWHGGWKAGGGVSLSPPPSSAPTPVQCTNPCLLCITGECHYMPAPLAPVEKAVYWLEEGPAIRDNGIVTKSAGLTVLPCLVHRSK